MNKYAHSNNPRIMIAGGGTGGHVFPAIAIANALKTLQPTVELLFVGAHGKMEMERVPKAGYPIKGLWVSGFQRSLSLKNLLFPIKLLVSTFQSIFYVKNFKPTAVVGVGGYASGPILQVAAWFGIPYLIQEQNSHAGVTNKMLAKKASKIAVAYEGMEAFFASEKTQLTGNPVRQDLANIASKKAEACAHFNLQENKKTILVLGGSLGARAMNDAIIANAEWIAVQNHLQILWQVGKLYWDEMQQSTAAKLSNVKAVPFVERMDLAYSIADVVISRAGALSISELCLVGKPTVLVPSPNVAEDHQTKNASALVKNGAAVLVKNEDASKKMLAEAQDILTNKEKSDNLSNNIRLMAKPNAALDIAAMVLQL